MKKINFRLLNYYLLIIIGLYSLIMPEDYLNSFHRISYISVLILGIYFLIKSIKKKKFDFQAVMSIIIAILLFVVIKKYPSIYLVILPITLGIYLLIIGITKLFTLLIYKDLSGSRINQIFSIILYLIFAILFIIFPNHNLKESTFIIGIFLIINGIEKLYHYYRENTYSNILKTPSILLTIKPYQALLKLKGQKFTNSNELCNVEVLIHVRHSKRGMFGHADLVYNDYVYSYGNYDNSTYKIFDAIGDGMVFKTKRNDYIKFCKEYGKTLFCFGLKLSANDKAELDKRFNDIMKNTYEWNKKNIIKGTYADQLNNKLDITFFKFNEGYRQKYFFLNYNCVKFIEEVISPKIVDLSTIKTPGILYSYLENEHTKKNSFVAYKNIY